MPTRGKQVGFIEVSPEIEQQRHTSRLGDWVPRPRTVDTDYVPLDGLLEEDYGILNKLGSFVISHVPILQWLPSYDYRNNLFYDVSGGSTIALICLVQTLAHASIASTSVIQGPYCAFVPPFVYAIFGTSPHASISSGAIAAILIADQLRDWPDIQDRTELASLLALTSGLMLVLLGLCKFAFLVRFLSQSLLSGFITGGSILIIIGQLGNLFGITSMPTGVGPQGKLMALAERIPTETNLVSLALGSLVLISLQTMMWLKKYTNRRLAGPKNGRAQWLKPVKIGTEMKELLLVFSSIAFAWATSAVSTDGQIVTLLPTVGEIPSGLPPYHVPWKASAAAELLARGPHDPAVHHFFFASFLVAVTTFLTTYSTSKRQALMHGYELHASQEMFALGMAGTCGSFFGVFPPSGSLSRTSLATEVGVKTQMSGLMKIVVVGLSLKFLTPVLFFLPKATLAGIILRATWSLVDLDTPSALFQRWKPRKSGGHRRDLVVWALAFVLTIWMGVIWGIGVSVIASLLMIVKDAAMPRMVVLGRLPGRSNIWREQEVWPEGVKDPGLLVIEFRGALSFACSDWFQEEIQRIRFHHDKVEQMRGSSVKVVILAFGSVHDLDPTALAMLKDLFEAWQGKVSCIVADAKSRVRLLLEEHFGQPKNGKKPLLDQSAFMIDVEAAVEMAQHKLGMKRSSSRDDMILKVPLSPLPPLPPSISSPVPFSLQM